MKDIPMFTTEYGVASLILKEVPYRKEAYIILQATEQPEELLAECVSFCRIVGAQRIYARGHEIVQTYPLHSIIFEMRGYVPVDAEKVKHLWPVTGETVGKWREMLNGRMKNIDNAGTLEKSGEQEILDLGGAYFVHDAGKPLGAGWIRDGELLLIASFEKGAGEQVLHTLLSASPAEELYLQVVSTNHRAIGFYERMGLVKTAELRRWYRVF